MYLHRRRQRETLVFAWISGVMAVLLIFSILIFFGLIPTPFFNDFKEPEKIAEAGDTPCPLSKTPVSPEKMTVKVVNGTNTSGLAKEVAEGLEERGLAVKEVGNISSGEYEGNVKLSVGPAGVNSGYTLARAFKEAEIVLDPRPTNDVQVIIGTHYTGMSPADEFKHTADDKLEPREQCRPVSTD